MQHTDTPPVPRSRLTASLLPVLVTLAVTAAYATYASWQWNTFTVKSWDLGIFTQMYKGYAAGELPIVAIKGDGFNLLGDHFHPLLAALTPVYLAFPSPLTLLVTQGACFGIAAGITTYAGLRLVGPVTGVVVGLACGLSWGLQYAVEAQFHEIALAVPLLSASLAALLLGRPWWAFGWAALLPFVKEDLGLTTVAIGVVLFLSRRRLAGSLLAGWGLLWFALAVFVVLPWLNPEGTWAYSDYLTGTGEDLPDAPVSWPPFDLFNSQKMLTTALLVLATAGMVLRSPLVIVLLPTLAWRFLSGNDNYWSPNWHYSAVLMPVAFLAVVDGVRRARASTSSTWERWWGRLAPSAVGLICLAILFLKPLPLTDVEDPGVTTPDPRVHAVSEVLDPIPDGASVLSDLSLMNYVVADHEVYWIGNDNPVPDYVVAGPSSTGPDESWTDALDMARSRHPGVSFELVAESGGYSLARRVGVDDGPPDGS